MWSEAKVTRPIEQADRAKPGAAQGTHETRAVHGEVHRDARAIRLWIRVTQLWMMNADR